MIASEEPALKQVKLQVQQKFNDIRAAIYMREKLLLRQLDVIAQAGRGGAKKVEETPKEGDVKFVTDEQEAELLATIRSFGRFKLENINLALQDVYLKNEDYIEPTDDHETMYKCLQETATDIEYDLDERSQPEAIVVDFSRNKSLVEDNAKIMNKSIINITLQEAKDLIYKAKIKRETHVPPLNLEELDDELESSIAEAVSSLGRESSHTCVEQSSKPKPRKPRFKPKITINNCNGTINLRNIASLTINCANEESVSAEIPLDKVHSADSSTTEQSTSTTTDSSNYSSNASSRSQSKKQKSNKKLKTSNNGGQDTRAEISKSIEKSASTTAEESTATQPTSNSYCYADDEQIGEDSHIVTCDFYNRLLNEIKKSLKEKPIRNYGNTQVMSAAADSSWDANSNTAASSICTSNSVATSSNPTKNQSNKRLILKNFENLKIILEANSGDEESFHPVQIEQWLAEIISETELEQNTEILEHSKINSSS